MARPALRLPAPLVFLVRSRTVAKVDSMAFVVRRWIRCSAGYAKWASSAARSSSSFSVAFGYLAPYVSWKRSTATSAASLFSAFMISCNAALAFGCRLLGSASRTLAILCTQQRCSRVSGNTSRRAAQKPSAPSPTASTAQHLRPRLLRLPEAVTDRDQLLAPVRPHAHH